MTTSASDVLARRLRSQKLARSEFQAAAEVVAWLGAVQAQDYAGAKWALGLRSRGASDAAIEQGFNEGAVLRTHLMRPTWHFVAPADIRWMLALTGPRVNAVNGPYYRKLGLDDGVFARSRKACERALQGGQHLTRQELAAVLQKAGIAADGMRLAYLMMHAELDGMICSGPRRGNQFTYALLEERVPPASIPARDEALAEIARRYFTSHGPASLLDFVWWSGLTVRDARTGIDATRRSLSQEIIDGRAYWSVPSQSVVRRLSPVVYLLPNYDEFGIAYRDRGALAIVPRPPRLAVRHEFAHLLAIDGRIVGRWKRTLKPRQALVEAQPFRSLTTAEKQALDRAAAKYGRFLNMSVTVSIEK
jgi:hypothetical protein